jgi:hypothetical protein
VSKLLFDDSTVVPANDMVGTHARDMIGVVDVNYPDRSATTILAGGSGE